MPNTIHPAKIYQVLLLAAIVGIALVLWRQLSFLFPSLLGAVALYILLKQPMAWLMKIKKLKSWVAAGILMLLTALLIVLPTFFIIRMLIFKALPFVESPQFFIDIFNKINIYLRDELGLNILNREMLVNLSGRLTDVAQQMISGTLQTVLILVFMYLFLFFMMINSRKMELYVRQYLPFRQSNKQKLLDEVTRMVRSNSITIPVVALLQGRLP
jgi:predicted PurR-regulated permease PerM